MISFDIVYLWASRRINILFKWGIIWIFFWGLSHKSYSQTAPSRHHIFLELGGVGGYGSFNYERIALLKNHSWVALRVGVSTYRIKDFTLSFNPDIIIPFTVNGCLGKQHKVEIGVGNTYSNIVHADQKDGSPQRVIRMSTIFSMGYRYQKSSKGPVFRCVYTPIIENHSRVRHWAGMSIGYAF
jgi:hypothetical protein